MANQFRLDDILTVQKRAYLRMLGPAGLRTPRFQAKGVRVAPFVRAPLPVFHGDEIATCARCNAVAHYNRQLANLEQHINTRS